MAGTIKISSDLDARGFLKGTENMEKALDDVSEGIEDVYKDGDKDLAKLEKSFAEAAKAAKDSGDEMKRGMQSGFKGTVQAGNDAATEIKDEFKSNLSEVTSSFDGSVESMGDLVQGTLGGLVSSLGPLGMAAGAAGAIGVGLIIASITQAGEESEETRARIQNLGQAMIDAASDGNVPLEVVIDNLKGIVSNSDDAVKSFKDIAKEADEAGLSAGALATAYAGGTEALEGQIDAYDDLIAQAEAQRDAEKEANGIATEASALRVEDLKNLQGELLKVQEETKAAAQAEQDWLNSGGAELVAKAEAIGTIDAAYDDAAGSILDFKDEESGVLDVQAYIDSMIAREKALGDYQTALAQSGFSTEQKAALNDMGIEASAAWMEGYKKASPAQQKEMERILTKTASESSGVASKEIEKAFKNPIEAKVEAKVDMAMAQRDLENLIKARSAIIKVDFQDRNGKRVY
jgi:hypothetical protein